MQKLTMDMHSVSFNVKFSLNDVMFAKYSTNETFEDIRENVIEELVRQFNIPIGVARNIWAHLKIEKP